MSWLQIRLKPSSQCTITLLCGIQSNKTKLAEYQCPQRESLIQVHLQGMGKNPQMCLWLAFSTRGLNKETYFLMETFCFTSFEKPHSEKFLCLHTATLFYIQQHIFLNMQISLSCTSMNLYKQSHLFSIQLHISCLHTFTCNHTVTAFTPQPHRFPPINLSYIHVSLLYTYICYISLPIQQCHFILFFHFFLHFPHFSLLSNFSYTVNYISSTQQFSHPFLRSLCTGLQFSLHTCPVLSCIQLFQHIAFSIHCSLF